MFMRQPGRLCRIAVVCLLISSGFVGCTEQAPIVSYSVPKHEAIQLDVSAPAEQMNDPTDRMLAAIVLDDRTAWFFKGSAPVGSFPKDAKERFDTLLASLEFAESDKPSWDLDENWEERPGSGMRVANLMLGDIEFSVIRLPAPPSNERDYIVSNVNRWRGQLQLGPINSAQLSNLTHKVTTSDGRVATVVDMLGKMTGDSMGPMSRPRQAVSSNPPPRSEPFTSTPPSHWQKQRAGMMQLAAFLVEDGDRSAKISVSRAGGELRANVDRWRGQIGLPPVSSEEEIDVKSVTVGGIQAQQVSITGEQGQSIVVALVPDTGSVWYFKLMGDTAVVEKESTAFDDFLSTVRFSNAK